MQNIMEMLRCRVKDVAGALGVEAEETGLPVVRVAGVCAVEVGVDEVVVMTRMSRGDVLSYDFSRLQGKEFEVYGAKNLSEDLKKAGEGIDAMKERVRKCGEEEICFSFAAEEEELKSFVDFLREEGFSDGKRS